MTLAERFSPTRYLQIAIALLFVLLTTGGNLFTYATPLWLVAVFAIAVCIICAFTLVFCIAWLRDGTVARLLAMCAIALALLSGVGVVMRLPPEMDSSAIELSIKLGVDRTQHALSVLRAAELALEGTEASTRLEYAKAVYRLTGRRVKYRDEPGQVSTFVPDADLRRAVEGEFKAETASMAAVEDFIAGANQRQMVKMLALIALLASACAAANLAYRPLKST